MYLDHFTIKDFRNLEKLDMEFDPNVNIFVGNNAQGKTNILEAIYFLALTRSHRTNSDSELIRFGCEYATLLGKVHKKQVDINLRVAIAKKGKKVWINRIEQSKLSKYIGQLNAILFSPEDLSLVKGAPSLRQRNNYLKQLLKNQAHDLVFLDVLSDQLAGIAAEIVFRRFRFLEYLSTAASDAYKNISLDGEKLTLVYHPSVSQIEADDSKEKMYQKIRANFKKIRDSELHKGTTLIGPHRDDIEFRLNQKNAHLYASQGQQRSIALAIKLAEISLIHHLTDEYPILLLDDVMSELDHERQSSLLNYIHGKTQTFITTTDLEGISWEIVNEPKIYPVKNGEIV